MAGVGAGVIPEGMAFAPATAGEMAGMGLGGAAGAGGAAAGAGSFLNNLGGPAKSLVSSIGNALTGNSSGGGMPDLARLLPGLIDMYQQGRSSDKMIDWLNGQQAKIDNLYSPGSPEFNSLFDQMSRKDAMAGRNSQYGPRSVDLAARIAQIKADNTARLTSGVAGVRQDSLNQDASKFAGLGGLFGSDMPIRNLSSLLTNFSDNNVIPQGTVSGGTMSNQDIEDMINGMGFGDSFDISEWWN
jgi:hypothetical protein